jgi:hypothetical protein
LTLWKHSVCVQASHFAFVFLFPTSPFAWTLADLCATACTQVPPARARQTGLLLGTIHAWPGLPRSSSLECMHLGMHMLCHGRRAASYDGYAALPAWFYSWASILWHSTGMLHGWSIVVHLYAGGGWAAASINCCLFVVWSDATPCFVCCGWLVWAHSMLRCSSSRCRACVLSEL